MTQAVTDRGSHAPAWHLVPFDVGCARCGHNLRGQTDPICPACELTFDWADAVPVERLVCEKCGYHLYGLTETRCPECGTPFTWDDALAAYHRRRLPLFEYQWRKRPIRSLITTWWRALRPGKFWRAVDIHDRVCFAPLLMMLAATLSTLLIVQPIYCGMQQFLYQQRIATLLASMGRSSTDLLPAIGRFALNPGSYISVLLPAGAWCLLSLVSLMLFQQSMRRYRVKPAHVLRVWSYSVVLALPVLYVATVLPMLLITAMRLYSLGLAVYLSVLSAIALVAWSVRQGYRHYLHMPHSLAVAVASQVVAVAATFTLLLFLDFR